MLFGTKQKLANASFKTQLHGSDIERVRNFCYLGVTLDEYLSWKEHVSKVFTKVNKRLGLLGRIRSCLLRQRNAYTTVSYYQSCATPTRPGVNCLLSARVDYSAYKIELHV